MSDYRLTSINLGGKAIINYKGIQDIIIESIAKVEIVTQRHKSGVLENYRISSYIRFNKIDGSTVQYPDSKIDLNEAETIIKENKISVEYVDEFI
ncbi:hypothetical protein SAMN04487895_101696 [Paenibacillus sophorae]|uniref:Uncharacterized protein n=1 Tax=Paenibacillus sophorae TaxID=1333845 RepID=A0A1H8H179_9BACL|nr:hypothetical protein [Paenibacillus sophorae]QWU14387.1 hypothetical protein KP014_20995 [Paenibacillus sophorae]SEN49238.1 hypothetical protein SAMN04487895_101696 [Paenibacillus sophorae]